MIKVKLQELVNCADALRQLGDKPLRGKLAYKVGKIIQQASNQLDLYDKARHQLLIKYCVKNKEGQIDINEEGMVQVIKENIPDYNNQLEILNNTELEINAVPLELNDFETIEMTPKQIMQL